MQVSKQWIYIALVGFGILLGCIFSQMYFCGMVTQVSPAYESGINPSPDYPAPPIEVYTTYSPDMEIIKPKDIVLLDGGMSNNNSQMQFISGSILNNGTKSYENVQITARIFNASGVSLGQATLAMDAIKPGETKEYLLGFDYEGAMMYQIEEISVY